jgi:GT2 family glycosyltransferase
MPLQAMSRLIPAGWLPAKTRARMAANRGPCRDNASVRAEIIIPTWNGREVLAPCLAAIREHCGGVRCIVIDNGSNDGTMSWLAEAWPEVDVIRLERNRGFATAVNTGIRHGSAEYVALLNNDVVVTAGWLQALTNALDAYPRAGSAASKLLQADTPGILDGAGDTVLTSGRSVRRGHGTPDAGQFDAPESIASACAAAALYRREAFKDVGLFDESYFAYHEDVDWGLRAQWAGWSCRYVPNAVALHGVSVTTRAQEGKPAGDWLWMLDRRNTVWTMAKCYPWRTLVRNAGSIALYQLAVALVAVRQGRARALPFLVLATLRGLPRILAERRRLHRHRRRSPSQVGQLIQRDRMVRHVLRRDIPLDY